MSEVPIPVQPAFTFAEVCDRGIVREENQDTVLHAAIPLGHLLVVADGIGGYRGGAVASRIVVESFRAYMAALPAYYPAQRAIEEAAASANTNVITAAKTPGSPYQRMGSTVVMALLQHCADGPRAWIGHIGDSRAYLVRDRRLIRKTNDHSAVQALINRNLITPEEALHHPDASVLTRSLGHQPQVEIDIEMIPLVTGDSLLLCSDGLWGYVPDREIERVAADPALNIERTARALLQLALDAGGHDNIGIELARLRDPAAQSPSSNQPRRRGFVEILALFLLIFAGLGALVSFSSWRQWLHLLRHLR